MSAIRFKRSRVVVNLKYMWHLRLGHIEEEKINRLMKDGLLDSFLDESFSVCESHLQEKMIKLPFIGHEKKIIEVLALVHSDVCDPFDIPVREGYLYFINFIDGWVCISYEAQI